MVRLSKDLHIFVFLIIIDFMLKKRKKGSTENQRNTLLSLITLILFLYTKHVVGIVLDKLFFFLSKNF